MLLASFSNAILVALDNAGDNSHPKTLILFVLDAHLGNLIQCLRLMDKQNLRLRSRMVHDQPQEATVLTNEHFIMSF